MASFLAHAEQFPAGTGLVVTVESAQMKGEVAAAAEAAGLAMNLMVIITPEDSGDGMAALWACREVFLSDRYDLVCRLHDQLPLGHLGLPAAYSAHIVGSLVASSGYISRIIECFSAQPWLGIAFPPLLHVSSNPQPNYRHLAEQMLRKMNVDAPIDAVPLFPQAAMFWFRPAALRLFFEADWAWDELNARNGKAAAQTLVSVAFAARFTVMEIISVRAAQLAYVRLDYWRQYFQKHLTVRSASIELLKAVNRSIRFRWPRLARILASAQGLFRPLITRIAATK